jgi:hypothetical protein
MRRLLNLLYTFIAVVVIAAEAFPSISTPPPAPVRRSRTRRW